MTKLSCLPCALWLFIISVVSTSEAEVRNDYRAGLTALIQAVGGTVEIKSDAGRRTVVVSVNREIVNRDFVKFQELKLLNPDITRTFIATHPNIAGMTIATTLAVMSVITEYELETTDQCRFNLIFLLSDDYGHRQTVPLFSFGFDRALYKKIDWDNFEHANLYKVAKEFKLSPWALAHLMD